MSATVGAGPNVVSPSSRAGPSDPNSADEAVARAGLVSAGGLMIGAGLGQRRAAEPGNLLSNRGKRAANTSGLIAGVGGGDGTTGTCKGGGQAGGRVM